MTRRNSRLTLLLRYTNGDDIFREPYKFTCTPTLTHVLYYARRRLVDRQLLHKNLRLAELPRAYVVHENPRESVAGPRRTARGRVTNGVLQKSRVRRHTRKRLRRCTLNGAKRFKYNFVRRQREKNINNNNNSNFVKTVFTDNIISTMYYNCYIFFKKKVKDMTK